MTDLEKFQKIKEKVNEAQKQLNRAQGSLSQLTSQLKEEFDCASLAEGKKLLKKLLNELEEEQEKFKAAVETFEKEYDDRLGNG